MDIVKVWDLQTIISHSKDGFANSLIYMSRNVMVRPPAGAGPPHFRQSVHHPPGSPHPRPGSIPALIPGPDSIKK